MVSEPSQPVTEAVPWVIWQLYSRVPRCSMRTIQETVYLLQAAGMPFGFSYEPHLFGPYSRLLQRTIQTQWMEGMLELESKGDRTLVTVSEWAVKEVEAMELPPDLYRAWESFGNDLLTRLTAEPLFRRLAALSTAHYAIVHLRHQGPLRELAAFIQRWTGLARRASDLQRALQELVSLRCLTSDDLTAMVGHPEGKDGALACKHARPDRERDGEAKSACPAARARASGIGLP